LLDEPSESLDAEGEDLLTGITQAHRAAGGLIVVATHARTPLSATAELVLRPVGEA
jgi:heme exporter protein A